MYPFNDALIGCNVTLRPSQMNRKIRYKVRGLWDMTRDALEVERRRLADGITDDEIIQGTTVCDYYFTCDGNAAKVLTGVKEVMSIVNEISLGNTWPTVEEWRHILPQWFQDSCAGEEELEEEGPTPSTFEERRAQFFSHKWKLSSWLSWMEPEDRRWLWLDAEIRDADTLLVHIDQVSDPCDLGEPPGVWWVFAAAGAQEFDEVRAQEDMVGVTIDESQWR